MSHTSQRRLLSVLFFSLVLIGLILPPAVRADELQDAVDNPEQNGTPLIFTSQTGSGGAVWAADPSTYTTAPASAKSGLIAGNMYSTLTTTVTGPASLSFYQKVSSQASSDTLKFMINGAVKSTISGSVNWQQKVFTLPTGTYTLQWKYSKNATVDSGSDAAWVDKIIVSPYSTVMVTGPTGNLLSGTTTTISWNAPAAAEKYALYYTTNGSTWVPIPGASAPNYLPGTGFEDQTFAWPVPTPAGNTIKAKIKVVAYNAANKIVAQGMSSVPFAITMLQVIAPNGGEAFNPVTNPTTTVSFMLYGQPTASTATLSYALNTATSGPTITTIPVSGAGTYTATWNLPAVTKATSARVIATLKSSKGATVGTDSSDGNFTILPSFSISGTVKQAGQPLAGATMSLSGTEAQATTTGSDGKYIFMSLHPGGYSVAASKSGSVFKPASLAVAVTTANVTTANFTGTASVGPTYTISGTVSGATGTAVVLTLSGSAAGIAMTDALGNYSFPNLPEGNYNVTPSKSGYSFDPLSSGVVLAANVASVDFSSTAGPVKAGFSVTGKITYGGTALGGVTVAADGPVHETVVTDSLGNYAIKGLVSGSYVMTPSATGFSFTPMNKSLTVAGSNIAGINFDAGRNIAALNGSYRVLQQSVGFFLYTGASTATAAGSYDNGYTAILTFDGAGNCSWRDDGGTEYSMMNDPGHVLVTATTPTAKTVACTYSMSPDGAATLNIVGVHVPVWISMDGNAFIWGNGGWSNTDLSGGATPVLNGGPVFGEQTVGIKMGTAMTTASVNGVYRLVQQSSGFGLSSNGTTTNAWSQMEGYTGTMTFDGQGTCAVHYDPAATYDMFEPSSITRILHAAGNGQCTYTVASDGTAAVSYGGFEVPVWFSADGNTFIWDSSITAIGASPVVNGDPVGHEQVVGVKTGSGMTTASLNGRYKVVQQSIGFGLYGGGITTGAYSYDNGYTATWSFNGTGGCSVRDDSGTEYSAANNPGNIYKNVSGPKTTACTYTVAANGTITVTIGGFHLPIWLSADGNTFVWGGSGWSNSSIAGGATPVVNGGPVYIEQGIGVRTGAQQTLVGSWVVSKANAGEGHTAILTFIDGSTFMYEEYGPSDLDSWPGIEYGTYTATADAFKLSVIADTNGGWGMSNLAGQNIPYSVSGPILTLGIDNTTNVMLTKIMPSLSNPLVGSWLLSPVTGGKAGNIGVLTFIDDTTFMYEEYGPADTGGSNGMEYGNYTWTGTTFNPATFIVDTNGNWGFSDAVGLDIPYAIAGSTLTLSGGTHVLKRIE